MPLIWGIQVACLSSRLKSNTNASYNSGGAGYYIAIYCTAGNCSASYCDSHVYLLLSSPVTPPLRTAVAFWICSTWEHPLTPLCTHRDAHSTNRITSAAASVVAPLILSSFFPLTCLNAKERPCLICCAFRHDELNSAAFAQVRSTPWWTPVFDNSQPARPPTSLSPTSLSLPPKFVHCL